MRHLQFAAIVVGLSSLNTAIAETEIHKCTDANGNVAYSQLPCVAAQAAEPEVHDVPEVPETETPEPDAPEPETADLDVTEEQQSACKKRYRDEIDAIDAEIGREYTPEKADDYKQQLLALTRKLRQC